MDTFPYCKTIRRYFSGAAALLLLPLLFCVSNPTEPEECTSGDCGETPTGGPGDWTPTLPACAGAGADGLDKSRPDLGLDSAIVIAYDGDSAEIVSNTYININYGNMLDVKIDGGHVVIKGDVDPKNAFRVNIVLSGSTGNGSFKVDASNLNKNLGLYMNGVNITNPTGPAVNIQKTGKIDTVLVHLVGCEKNFLADGVKYDAPQGDEQAKGTFFSEGAVAIVGGGSLEIRSKGKSADGLKNLHAMVIDNHFVMKSGNIIIHESVNDGIHVNRNISITNGTLQIKSTGDAIQNEKNFPVNITGGKLTLWTTGEKSHGIACDSNDVKIGGSADIDIKITVLGKGAKGIRSRRNVEISGGTINISTYGGISVTPSDDDDDNTDNTSSAAGVRAASINTATSNGKFSMTAGTLTIRSTGDNSKGINADGGVTVGGGKINIKAIGDGIKTDGEVKVTGGEIYTESAKKKAIDCTKESIEGGTVVKLPK